MIRQAISCDICGAEKKQTNHWFVVYDQAGELRVSGWNSRNRLRAGSRHLCGQTCLHKLVDEFISRTLAARGSSAPAEVEEHVSRTDASLTSKAAHAGFESKGFESREFEPKEFESDEFESSARLITPAAPIPPQRVSAPVSAALVAVSAASAVVAMPARPALHPGGPQLHLAPLASRSLGTRTRARIPRPRHPTPQKLLIPYLDESRRRIFQQPHKPRLIEHGNLQLLCLVQL